MTPRQVQEFPALAETLKSIEVAIERWKRIRAVGEDRPERAMDWQIEAVGIAEVMQVDHAIFAEFAEKTVARLHERKRDVLRAIAEL